MSFGSNSEVHNFAPSFDIVDVVEAVRVSNIQGWDTLKIDTCRIDWIDNKKLEIENVDVVDWIEESIPLA